MTNLAGWRLLVFSLCGAAAIVLLASLGVPRDERTTFDRHTGERGVRVETAADAYFEARAVGETSRSLDRIRGRLKLFPDHPALIRARAILQAELGGALDDPDPAHPVAPVVLAEQSRALLARDELQRRQTERLDKQALLGLLENLEADRAVARALEDFFDPLLHDPPDRPLNLLCADEWAVRTLERLDRAERPPTPDDFLQVADAYRALGRTRARVRWLLRGYAALPPGEDLHEELATAYIENGRLGEALLVTGAALLVSPDDLALVERRAQLAAWLSLPRIEAEALETLVAAHPDRDRRERLVTLYEYVGEPEKAIPHVQELSRGSTDRDVQERAAILALEADNTALAFELLEDLATTTDDEAYWRSRILSYAWQNLDFDRMVEQLERLRRLDPEGDWEKQLESVYHRTGRTERLVLLLEERLARTPDDEGLEQQILLLHYGLGNEERVRAILSARLARESDPHAFFARLAMFVAMEVPGVRDAAQRIAATAPFDEAEVDWAISALRPFLDDDGFREAARVVAHRHAQVESARLLLLEMVDTLPTDAERAAAAEELARQNISDPVWVRAWIDRASWAGATESEIRAREVWAEREPGDLENRRALAHLYAAVTDPASAVVHWRRIVEEEGIRSDAVLELVDSLFAVGELEEAVAWLEKRASLPETSIEDRLFVADQLFGGGHWDRAMRFYLAVLDLDVAQPDALLRIGQIRLWSNDPRGAVPFLERRLAVTDEQEAEVRFSLGEAWWAIRDEKRAREEHGRALELLEPRTDRTIDQDVMVARMLMRLERFDEAQPIFERVLAQRPDELDLVLDYADALLAVGRYPYARVLIDRARATAPDSPRALLYDGRLTLLEKRYEEAAVLLAESVARDGTDAGKESELGRARELAGQWQQAREAYGRSLALQPANRDVEDALHRVVDELAGLLAGELSFRSAADDTAFGARASASVLWPDERTRLGASLGLDAFSGRADAVDAGATDVESTVLRAALDVSHRFHRASTVAGGLTFYPGAEGDAPVGGWLGLTWVGSEPWQSLGLRVHLHDLLEDPTAAPGLGGRTSGVRLSGLTDVGTRFWASAEIAWQSLSIEAPGEGTVTDGLLTGMLTFGWRAHEGQIRVADTLQPDRSGFPGLVGPRLEIDPAETDGPLVSVWVTYSGLRLLDDKRLATLLPLGERFDYLVFSGRADLHLRPGLGVMVEGGLGTELSESDLFLNLDAALTWRPDYDLEFTARAGYGRSLARSDAADVFRFALELRYRW